jgi:hypothetical protein
MLHLNINLTSLAAILWSGMLIISGSIWILSSQVRRLTDILESRAGPPPAEAPSARPLRASPSARLPRVAPRRGAALTDQRASRPGVPAARRPSPLASTKARAIEQLPRPAEESC